MVYLNSNQSSLPPQKTFRTLIISTQERNKSIIRVFTMDGLRQLQVNSGTTCKRLGRMSLIPITFISRPWSIQPTVLGICHPPVSRSLLLNRTQHEINTIIMKTANIVKTNLQIWIPEVAKKVGKITFTTVRKLWTKWAQPSVRNTVQIIVIGAKLLQPWAKETLTRIRMSKCTVPVRTGSIIMVMVTIHILLCKGITTSLMGTMVCHMNIIPVIPTWWVVRLLTCTILLLTQARCIIRNMEATKSHTILDPTAFRIIHLEVQLAWVAGIPMGVPNMVECPRPTVVPLLRKCIICIHICSTSTRWAHLIRPLLISSTSFTSEIAIIITWCSNHINHMENDKIKLATVVSASPTLTKIPTLKKEQVRCHRTIELKCTLVS